MSDSRRHLRLLVVVPVLFTLLFVWAGLWQWERGDDKAARLLARQQALAAAAIRLQLPHQLELDAHLRISGRWLPQRQLLLDNQSQQRRPGYRVWTALDAGDSWPLILVDRGWVEASPHREKLPDIRLDDDLVSIDGIWAALPRPGIELEADACKASGWPRRVHFPTAVELECIFGRAVAPGLLLMDADHPAGFSRLWTAPGIPPQRHYGYAFQWFALAVVGLVLTLIIVRRGRAR